MKKTLLASAIAVAFGLAGQAMANPVINNTTTGTGSSASTTPQLTDGISPGAGGAAAVTGPQSATANSDQSKNSGPTANEYSNATQTNTDSSTNTDTNTETKTETSTSTSTSTVSKNNNNNSSSGSAKATAQGAAAANNGGTATSSMTDSFNPTCVAFYLLRTLKIKSFFNAL